MIRRLLFITTAVVAAAQTPSPQMNVPSLGYVFDGNTKAIRLISGVPGAASLDHLVSTNATSLDSGFVHSGSRVAIANTKEGSVVLVQWSATPQITKLTTSLVRVTQVAFSLAGDRAAITDGSVVEVWSGLSDSPARAATFTPDNGVTALAINPDGLAAAATGAGAMVLLSDQPRQIAAGGKWTSLAFLPNGTDLLAADAAAQNLTLIRDVLTDAAASVVLSLHQEPDAVAVSADGSRAALASPGTLTIVSLADGTTTSISCSCQAARFDRLAGNLVLHLTDSQSGSELLLDADSAQARVMSLSSVNSAAVNGVTAQ
ncbi:MAG TPA: hypothetical protein VKG25_07550 [Bryobacteraceae bacterium]|nr:hypothetical protein [Bryobacteraceae bacterium]